MLGWVNKLLGGRPWERELKRVQPLVEEINEIEPELQELDDAELRDKTTELRGRLLAGEDLDSLLPEAFAAVREAARRTHRHAPLRRADDRRRGPPPRARSPRCGLARARRWSRRCRCT